MLQGGGGTLSGLSRSGSAVLRAQRLIPAPGIFRRKTEKLVIAVFERGLRPFGKMSLLWPLKETPRRSGREARAQAAKELA